MPVLSTEFWPHPAVTKSEAWEIIHLRSVRILSSVCPPLAEETEPHPPEANGWGVEGSGRDDGGVGMMSSSHRCLKRVECLHVAQAPQERQTGTGVSVQTQGGCLVV